MSTLLIFGDSYSADVDDKIYHYNRPDLAEQHEQLLSFRNFLEQSNRFDTIKNFSLNGCSLWYQYLQFKENYTGNEKVLWFVTNPGRLYHPQHGHLANYHSADAVLQMLGNTDPERSRFADIAKHYFMYVQNWEQEVFEHMLLLERIQKECSAVFVPCFNDSIHNEIFITKNSLLDISIKEQTYWGSPYIQELTKDCYDIRKGHMIEQNHKILADKILHAFDQNEHVSIDVEDFAFPNESDKHRYLVK
jgi:hypothetical protein